MKSVDPFDPVVPLAKRDPRFEAVRTHPQFAPARDCFRLYFGLAGDVDGNFIEQFQTTGFDARTWEMYLFSTFYAASFHVTRAERPDLLLERRRVEFALEAVTANPTANAPPIARPTNLAELAHFMSSIVPMRYGGALSDKLKKKYWELPQVKGKPFVLAIEPFYAEHALEYSDSALTDYLYGVRTSATVDAAGNVGNQTTRVESHQNGAKVIPSGFFRLPGAENVSAVLFSNSGTFSKFNRMGKQARPAEFPQVRIFRKGTCLDSDPRASLPLSFDYEVGDGQVHETWCQEMIVLHNPSALRPLGLDVFDDFLQRELLPSGELRDTRGRDEDFHPISSKTVCLSPESARPAP